MFHENKLLDEMSSICLLSPFGVTYRPESSLSGSCGGGLGDAEDVCYLDYGDGHSLSSSTL